MKARLSAGLGMGVGLLSATVFSLTLATIYREGNLLPGVLSFLIPVVALLGIYQDPGKRVFSSLVAVIVVSVAVVLYLTLAEDNSSFVFFIAALLGIAVPIGIDLVLLDTGTRVMVGSAVSRSTAMVFVLFSIPLATLLVSSKHREIVQEDQALIREVAQHVQPGKNAIVFDQVNPKDKVKLRNRVSVRAKGKTFQLANAKFESVSEERTVRKETEKSGARKSLVISREREEQIRVILDLKDVGMPDSIVLFSTRGPLTVFEQEVSLAGVAQDDDPVS
jgi:membrane protein YdbS with pleckstrin-like domain